jgi:hypothetical protein
VANGLLELQVWAHTQEGNKNGTEPYGVACPVKGIKNCRWTIFLFSFYTFFHFALVVLYPFPGDLVPRIRELFVTLHF